MRKRFSAKAIGAVLAGVIAFRIASRLLPKSDLTNAVVFITGSSRGLGLAIAMECARAGARIVLCARGAEALERAAEQLQAMGADVLAIPCDVRRTEEIQAAIRRAASEFQRIDLLVNNAGTIAVGPMDAMTREDYQDAMDTHFWAMRDAVEAVVPIFERQGGGRIANVTSIGGKISVPHLLPYCVSKFAATGYSEGLRSALASKNISVTTVIPGLMRTGSPRNAWFKSQHEKEYTWFALSDSFPISSIAASAAARAIIDATLRGEAEIVLSLPAKLAVLAQGAVPGIVASAMKVASRFLPGLGGVQTSRMRGYQSATAWTRSPLTALGKKAEREYNQL